MRIRKIAVLIFSLMLAQLVHASEAPAVETTTLAQQLKAIKEKRESIQADKRKAELLKDEESILLLNTLDKFLEAQTACFEKADEIEADICVMTTLKKLAAEQNFIAEHELANLFLNSYGNQTMAKVWFKKALDNPKTPRAYKIIILKSMDEINAKENDKANSTTEQTPEKMLKEQGVQ